MRKQILNYIIRPSKIEGVGVFTTSKIKEGEIIQIFDYSEKDTILISEAKANKNKELYEMCERYGVLTKKGYWAPEQFNRMYIGWYLNHSTTPNCGDSGTTIYRALRDIQPDEELTIDYRTLDREIDNSQF